MKDPRYIFFKNGLYDLDESRLIDHTPKTFTIENLGFNYSDVKIPTPWFDKYMENFVSDPKTQEFLQAWVTLLLHSHHYTQTFFYLEGPGGTGKSIFENICKALVGINNCVSTTLASMNSARFETINFLNKQLVTISDSEGFKGSYSRLKNITGGDMLQGRIKLTQVSFDYLRD